MSKGTVEAAAMTPPPPLPRPASLPPRPRHTFSLRTVERLLQQSFEHAGTHVRPEQIPAYAARLQQRLRRLGDALRFRLESQPCSPSSRTLLSKFERIRVGHLLADVVLDIATISIASSGETYDTAVSTWNALSLATPRVDATPLLSGDAEARPAAAATAWETGDAAASASALTPLSTPPVERLATAVPVPVSARSVSPLVERAMWLPERAALVADGGNSGQPSMRGPELHESAAGSHPLSFSESSLSPRSVPFKRVFSMHSGADSYAALPTPARQRPSCPPRRYYDIDFEMMNSFKLCLRRLQQLNLTDSEFADLRVRYAIPGVRMLNPDEELFFALSRHVEQLNRVPRRVESLPGETDLGVKRTISQTSTGGGTEAEADHVGGRHGGGVRMAEMERRAGTVPPWREDADAPEAVADCRSDSSTREHSGGGGGGGGHVPPVGKDHCLPLFRGGMEEIVQKKDLHIFLALVDARLRQVDQEIGGGLHAAGADWPSSSGEEDALHHT